MSDVFVLQGKIIHHATIKNSVHFYRDFAILMSILKVREIIARYQAAKPLGERLN
jgi:hypothetical protein